MNCKLVALLFVQPGFGGRQEQIVPIHDLVHAVEGLKALQSQLSVFVTACIATTQFSCHRDQIPNLPGFHSCMRKVWKGVEHCLHKNGYTPGG